MRPSEVLQQSDQALSGLVNNATATATIASPSGGARIAVVGVWADYSAAVNSVKTITINGSNTVALRWDFTNGPANISLPNIVYGSNNTGVTVTLAASGSAGVTGQVIAFYAIQM